MFVNQYVYYKSKDDTIPCQIKKISQKTAVINVDGKEKRVKLSNLEYQETSGGYIDVDVLERLLISNSKNVPEGFIIQDDFGTWQGIGIIRERKATNKDYEKYPQVVMEKYITGYEWSSLYNKGIKNEY